MLSTYFQWSNRVVSWHSTAVYRMQNFHVCLSPVCVWMQSARNGLQVWRCFRHKFCTRKCATQNTLCTYEQQIKKWHPQQWQRTKWLKEHANEQQQVQHIRCKCAAFPLSSSSHATECECTQHRILSCTDCKFSESKNSCSNPTKWTVDVQSVRSKFK